MTRSSDTAADGSKPNIGTAERLVAYVFAVFCLITLIMDSPVPMAIAP